LPNAAGDGLVQQILSAMLARSSLDCGKNLIHYVPEIVMFSL
jgi:hypothetical protein